MGLGKSIGKLDDYYDRLARNKTTKIKPADVAKVLGKLRAKAAELRATIDVTTKAEKRQRLDAKLTVVQEQIRRGEWLQDQVSSPQSPD